VDPSHHKQACKTDRQEHPPAHIQARLCHKSVRHGVDIRHLKKVLEHLNINITAVYLQFNDKDVRKRMQASFLTRHNKVAKWIEEGLRL
jgi:site-specific recombinase XerD